MRFLLDQGLPWSTALILTENGIPTRHVSDLGLAAAIDEEIFHSALERDFVIVTLDADFHVLLGKSRASRPSIIRIRQEGLRGPAMAELLMRVIPRVQDALEQGAAVSVKPCGRIGVRLLPILR